jgi:hypothetical protein
VSEVAIAKLKRYKSPGSDVIPAALIQAGGKTLRSGTHKLIKCIWNAYEFPHQCKESATVSGYKKGDQTCVVIIESYQLSTSYKIFCNMLLSVSPYTDEITGDRQFGFPLNRSTTDQIFSIHQILGEKWEYKYTLHQLFIDFQKAFESVRKEVRVLCNILRVCSTHETC